MKNGKSTSQAITQQIRQHIASGKFQAGDSLPAERALAQQYGVSRPTIRTALLALVHEGHLVRSRGRGSVVVEAAAGKPIPSQPILLRYTLLKGRLPENDAFLALVTATLAALPEELGRGVRVQLIDPDDPDQPPLPESTGSGIVFGGMCAPTDAMLHRLSERGIPMVLIGERTGTVAIPEIRADHRRAGELAAQHLLAHGHRRIALIDGPASHHPCRLRGEGFLAAGGTAVIEGCAWSRARSRLAIETALSGSEAPTAIVVAGDQGLAGAADVLHTRGLVAPRDLALLAIGLHPLAIPALEQPVTAFVANIPAMALTAARLLAALRAGRPAAALTLVPDRLQIGRTCGCVEPSTDEPRPGAP